MFGNILARLGKKGALLLLALCLSLAPAGIGWSQLSASENGGHGHDSSGPGSGNGSANDAKEAAEEAIKAMQDLGGVTGASPTTTLSSPGQAVTATGGQAPSGGASQGDRAKLNGTGINLGAWSPF